MTLRLFNSLTKTKEDFAPLDPKNVRMYVCGPTVYDFAHIGNARPVIVFDVLFRLLRHVYGDAHVTYVRNITDVDDKINARAAERGISIRELTEETARIYDEDVAALGNLAPDRHAPRHRACARDDRHDRERWSQTAMPMPRMAMCCSTSRPSPITASWRGARWTRCWPARGWKWRRTRETPMDFVLWKPSEPALPGWE